MTAARRIEGDNGFVSIKPTRRRVQLHAQTTITNWDGIDCGAAFAFVHLDAIAVDKLIKRLTKLRARMR